MNWRPLLHVAKWWHMWRCSIWHSREIAAERMREYHMHAGNSADRVLYPPAPIDPIETFRKQNNL